MSDQPAAAQVPAPVAAQVPVKEDTDALPKVFVGNLSFQTTDEDLATAFAAAGPVVKAKVIRRFGRSQGYAFVSFQTQSGVEKAVQLLNKTELGGRPINVDAAKPKEQRDQKDQKDQKDNDQQAQQGQPKAPKQKRDRSRKKDAGEARIDSPSASAVTDGVAAPSSVTAAVAGDTSDAKPLKKRNNRKKNKKPANANAEAASAAEGNNAPAAATSSASPAAPTDAASTQPKPRTPRAPRTKLQGPSSKTTLFVANLPFKVDSDALKKIFAEYQVASAKVVTLRNGRSKGFGFVELVSETEQQKVLKDLEDASLNVDGRDLNIRVALTLEEKPAVVESVVPAAAPVVAIA
ncbi:UNVERIFIED_CONTAM: hypothetical protein HDU68_007847 [Siphonaria sp. JEL0065]|nr:hypothetical protein HDU68_007847 [Siphonaria sp. JEL0065]